MSTIAFLDMQEAIKIDTPDASLLKRIASVALGIAISRIVAMPTKAIGDANNYYLMELKSTVTDYIGHFNENMLIDVSQAHGAARAFWLTRYVNAYPEGTINTGGEGCFLMRLAGGSRLLSRDLECFCEANVEAIFKGINKALPILKAFSAVAPG